MGVSGILFKMYGINSAKMRKFLLRLVVRLEGGEYCSKTLRDIFRTYFDVDVGLYSHGGCFVPGSVDRHTSIGRYCSIARTVRVFNRNHPLEFKSMHAFFFNPALEYCNEDLVEYTPVSIGNDVWLGHNCIILPNVKTIGDGAVVAAGAIINKDIPPYAVAVGNPARVVRYRFSKGVIEELLASKWWEKSIEEILPHIDEFQRPYETRELL